MLIKRRPRSSMPVGYSIWLTGEDGEVELWRQVSNTWAMLQEFKEVQQALPGLEYAVTEDYSDFGGFLGRKGDGHPGPKAIWQGMQRVREFALAFEAGKVVYASSG